MKTLYLFGLILFGYMAVAIGAEVPAVVPVAESIGILATIWTLLQTPQAIGVILLIWGSSLALLFAKRPKWQQYYDRYRGTLVEAVKFAEKTIPDGTDNKSAARADEALKYVLKIIGKADEKELKQAINVVHAEVEK